MDRPRTQLRALPPTWRSASNLPESAFEGEGTAAVDSGRQSERMTTGRGATANETALQKRRSGLGTEFGEAVSSHITEVEFVRATPKSPGAMRRQPNGWRSF